MFSLGTETDGIFRTRPNDQWPEHFRDELREMVSQVRQVYSGLLTYNMFYGSMSTNRDFWGEANRWLWQDLDLDVIGTSAYYELVDDVPQTRLSYAQIEAAQRDMFTSYLLPLQADNPDIPIVFTEYGFTDSIGSPFISTHGVGELKIFEDSDSNGLDDGEETQAELFKAFFEVNREFNRMVRGAFVWEATWADDELFDSLFYITGYRDFTPRGKLAEDVLRDEYAAME